MRLLECTHYNKYINMVSLSTESVATAAVVFVWTCSLSSANIQTAQTNFTRGIKVATNYMTLQSYSKIKCVGKCFDEKRHGRCSIAGYNLATRTCYLSNDIQDDLLSTDDTYGVFLYPEPEGMFNCEYNNIV